nr:MAG: hypothetical protein [uncultured archaeon]
MARKIPFSYNFSVLNDSSGFKEFNLGYGRSLRSLTANIQEDNLGPMEISFYILVEGVHKQQIGQPQPLYDGEGYSTARRFQWAKELPMSRVIENKLFANYSNYCGDDLTIEISGFKER